MKKKMFIVAAVFYSSQLAAQDTAKTRQLDEWVVTATRSAVKQSQTGKVVTVIDQATLRRNPGKSVAEILNTQAGIFVAGANNPLGTNQDLYFRGAATGNMLILINGAPVGDASQINNSFDLNNLNTAHIERIEVLKGAQSTLWGSDAVAGVINIITKTNSDKKISPDAGLSYGSYNTFRANAGVSGKLNRFTYNVSYGFNNTKGFSSAYDSTGKKDFDNDKFRQSSVLAAVGYQFSDRFSASYTANYSRYNAGIDAGAFSDDRDFTVTNSSFTNALGLRYKMERADIHLLKTITYAKRDLHDDSAHVGGFNKWAEAGYKGYTDATDLYADIKLSNLLSLVAGAQYVVQNTDQSYKSISAFGPFNSVPLGKDSVKANNISAYASLMLFGLGGFNAEAGFRYNHHSIYGNNTTFTLNPSYNIDDNTRVFVNIGSGYKVPSLYQLYSEYGNRELKPEKSMSYELGVQTQSDSKRAGFRVVAFKRDITDMIIFYTDPVTFEGKYINRDKQHDYGFELESNIAVGRQGNWINNLTYVDGEGINNEVKVKNLYRRPNFTFNSVLTVVPVSGLTLMPSFRFVGSRLKGEYDAGPAQMPHYYTVDFYAAYALTRYTKLFTDFRNITNQQYFDIPGYNSRGSNFTVGVQCNL